MKTGNAKREAIDWSLVKQCLATAEAALEMGFALTPKQRHEILRTRAHALALPPQEEALPSAVIEVLEFCLAHENYAIDMTHVHEVYTLKELTPLPSTPPFVLGIMNIRGRILSIIDLKRLFDLPNNSLTDLNKVVVLQNAAMQFGVLADRIIGVRQLPLNEIQAPLPTLTGIRANYLKGVTVERLIVLDAKKLLDDRSIVVEQEVL